MANASHLEILKSGMEPWNTFRARNPNIKPDLSCTDLSGMDLSRFNFTDANQYLTSERGADLSWSPFCNANLQVSDFSESILHNTNLCGADLSGANFRSSDMYSSSMIQSRLVGADFSEAMVKQCNFDNASFENVIFDRTIFVFSNIGNATGINNCEHKGPSSVDFHTITSTKNIGEAFLRGCGFSDIFIDYFPSLINQPIQYYSLFISYSSVDDDFAKRIYADLQTQNVRCWFAPEDMKIGDKIRTRLDEVIRLHEKLLIVLSNDSINSDWVEQEVETALEKERDTGELVLFPIQIDNAIFNSDAGWAAHIKRTRHIGDFEEWKNHDAYKRAIDRLLRDLLVG